MRGDPKSVRASLLKEFIYRRQIALKSGYDDVTGRLIGFVEWMSGVPLISQIITKLQKEGKPEDLLFTKIGSHRVQNRHIDARTIEQIASVGLELIKEAEKQGCHLYEVGLSFQVFSEKARSHPIDDSQAILSRFVIPFLDYVEQRLPAPLARGPRQNATAPVPKVIFESLRQFQGEHGTASARCFVMMRFGETGAHARIEKTIKQVLEKHGIVGLLARDKEFHDDLFSNILTYAHGCDFGIAVFERLKTDEFNPNVALEVGYILGLSKQVLLLKDQTLRALHTDLVGKLYREFDPQSPEETIPPQIDRWLRDKGLA
jgi:hypothetical protein